MPCQCHVRRGQGEFSSGHVSRISSIHPLLGDKLLIYSNPRVTAAVGGGHLPICAIKLWFLYSFAGHRSRHPCHCNANAMSIEHPLSTPRPNFTSSALVSFRHLFHGLRSMKIGAFKCELRSLNCPHHKRTML